MKRLTLVLIIGILYGGDNFYIGGDNNFNRRHSTNEAYIKTISKNKAYNKMGDASYVKIDSKEEFKKALESGALNQKIDTNKVTKTYRAIDISNVRLNKNDIKELTKNRDRVIIGSEVEKGNNLMQSINIKNSKIKTDKKLNIGVVSRSSKISGITNYTNIQRSSIEGGEETNRAKKRKSRLDKLEDLDNF